MLLVELDNEPRPKRVRAVSETEKSDDNSAAPPVLIPRRRFRWVNSIPDISDSGVQSKSASFKSCMMSVSMLWCVRVLLIETNWWQLRLIDVINRKFKGIAYCW